MALIKTWIRRIDAYTLDTFNPPKHRRRSGR